MLFFFTDTATPEIYTLPLHDALPICRRPEPRRARPRARRRRRGGRLPGRRRRDRGRPPARRSEEHTSELQSRSDIVCRLLLAKKPICIYCTTPPLASVAVSLSKSNAS